MIYYRVCFYNLLSDDTGHEHHVCQRQIDVSTGGEKEALAQAIREFERDENVSDWTLRASEIQCNELPLPPA